MPTYLCHGFRWQRQSVRVYVILQDLDDASPEWIIPAKSSRCILKSFYEAFDFLPHCNPERGCYNPTPGFGGHDGGRAPSDTCERGLSTNIAAPGSPPSNAPKGDFDAQSWSAIKLLEEYDPNDLSAVSRPYVYVADYAVRIDLSCSIADEIARYEQQQLQSGNPATSISSDRSPAQGPGWFERLRDQLQQGEEIRWYVVVNNDEVRNWSNPPSEPERAIHAGDGGPASA
ncbi:hypothetical protein VTG60DRAFT_2917 [Thermothelomyces hinnuleus]